MGFLLPLFRYRSPPPVRPGFPRGPVESGMDGFMFVFLMNRDIFQQREIAAAVSRQPQANPKTPCQRKTEMSLANILVWTMTCCS